MIVTGGGRGIGAATALLAARRGYAVVVNYLRDEATATALVERISPAEPCLTAADETLTMLPPRPPCLVDMRRSASRPVVPMQRPGRAEEVANAILWLCSAEASYCTGSILEVTGGR